MSQTTAGQAGIAESTDPDISTNGRYVAFQSWESNLVLGDTNGARDIFRLDRATGQIIRVSLTTAGGQAAGISDRCAISGDGTVITFETGAALDPADSGIQTDVYMHSVATGTTAWVSRSMTGGEPDRGSFRPTVSEDGGVVVFDSDATDLVPGDTNGQTDVFAFDAATGLTTRVSVASDGSQGVGGPSWLPSVSADGRYVAFASSAKNFVPGGDKNGVNPDVFVHDRVTGITELVSVDSSGKQSKKGGADPAISGPGRHVAFVSYGGLLPGSSTFVASVVVHDRQTGETTQASLTHQGIPNTYWCSIASISDDGRMVAFATDDPDMVPGDTNGTADIFLRDRLLGTTRRVSETPSGQGGNGPSIFSAVSGDGTVVAFDSISTNLLPGLPGSYQVLASNCGPIGPASYCTAMANSQGCLPAMTWAGTASASATASFDLAADQLINRKFGTLVYGTQSWAANPFLGGTLCVEGPMRRTPLVSTGGTGSGAADCSGAISVDFNARIASGVDPALVPGATVYAQFLSRDPAAPGTVHLTDAVSFSIAP